MFGLEFLAAKKTVVGGVAFTVTTAASVAFVIAVVLAGAANGCGEIAQHTDPGEAWSSDTISGPVGGPVKGRIDVATANIPNRTSNRAFADSLATVVADSPDFVTLNEVGGRSLKQIRNAAPGYGAYRSKERDSTPGGSQAMNNVVLWRKDTWSKVNAGRVKIVDADKGYHSKKKFTWSRYATWGMFQRGDDAAVVSVVSVHHMTNPAKFPKQHGDPPMSRAQMYGFGMDRLLELRNKLATHGPVLIGGDMNTGGGEAGKKWSAMAKMSAAGYGWANHGVDFVFYPAHQGVKLRHSKTGRMASDHQWVWARLAMKGAGPTTASSADDESSTTSQIVNTSSTTTAAGGVLAELQQTRLRDDYPLLTREQAENLISIGQVAQSLDVPHRGLVIAIATAIQESKLVNLPGGDRDSGGLFQQRPSTGWGTRAQVTDPTLATLAFFGRAEHTTNTGLLDIPNWQSRPLTEAAQAVQRSGYPNAYAQWETVATQLAGMLDVDLAGAGTTQIADLAAECTPASATVEPVTLGTFNILGASHTSPGGKKADWPDWDTRLPKALDLLDLRGVTIAGLQEVHKPQQKALARDDRWGMYPAQGRGQNKVIWDTARWTLTSSRLVDIPYFGGKDVGMPLVKLTSTSTGQAIWVWSIHNPASTRGDAREDRIEALRRQLAVMGELKASGDPAVILGDFNDRRDGKNASHCALTPILQNAFGGTTSPCKAGDGDAPLDHVYGTNLTWADAAVVRTRADQISDHPLVVATTAGSALDCAAGSSSYNLGPVKPQLTRLVNILGPKFNITTVGGYRESARDPRGHPAGLAADFMVPLTPAGKKQGDQLAAYAREHARELGIDYIIWYQRIWSVARADEGWRPMASRGSDSADHRDHVHINVLPTAKTVNASDVGSTPAACGTVSLPVPVEYASTDRHNWGKTGSMWSSWHSGTDFSAPCGTPVLAAHAGTITVERHSWSGPLVKVSVGPGQLTTWYAHMQTVTVTNGQMVAAGQMIGRVGTEGNSTGCHLHFEVNLNGGTQFGDGNVNPTTWLAQQLGSGVPA